MYAYPSAPSSPPPSPHPPARPQDPGPDLAPRAPDHPAPLTCRRRTGHAAPSGLAKSILRTVEVSGKWTQWQAADQRLAAFNSLEDVRLAWRRRDERCYQVVAALTALGSRRGGDDDEAALAVLVLLEEGIKRVAITLSDVCELVDVHTAVWGEVKAAEPQPGTHAARYLLQRARQRLTRPAAGMIPRIPTTSLDQRLGWGPAATDTRNDHARDLLLAVPEVEDPVEDLADLLAWAQNTGVIAPEEVDLLVELLAAENDGMAREEAQRAVGERHGVTMRTVRRRRDRAASRLRESVPEYLATIA